MEKGNGARHPTSSKGNSSEAKNKQDAGLKHSRFPRYKDGASPRSDSRRKSNPQKSREGFDKRPRTRSGAFCERYWNEIVDNVNVGPFPKQGSKKVNLNHLLNFTLTPVDGRDSGSRLPIRTRLKLPKYKKELFLQANCQFVTQDDGNYALHCQNPDNLIGWALIEEVRLPSYDIASCPICLYPPVAAKITRCGHIYCWSCILHYLALTDRSWQKCPICFEAVHQTDLKSVVPVIQKQIVVGSEVTMCLMKREKGTMLPVPATVQSVSTCKISDDASVTRFQKLLLASKCEVGEIIRREWLELEKQLMLEKDAPEACFIQAALKLLQERGKNLESVDVTTKSTLGQKINNDYNNQTTDKYTDINNGNFNHSTTSETMLNSSFDGSDHAKVAGCDNLVDNVFENEHSYPMSPQGNDAYYFYQADDGQHIYLHNMNVRMLTKEFGSLKDSLTVVRAKVVELENVSMTEAVRKRLRYLQHIPLTCEFQVAELDFRGVLSAATVKEFNGEILNRRKQRNRKAREEWRREKHIAEEENRKLGKFPEATYNLNSIDQFPVCVSKRELDSKDVLSSSPGNEGYEIEYPSVGIANLTLETDPVAVASSPPTTSFAQMLREGQTSFNQSWTRKPVEVKPIAVQVKDLGDDDDEEHVPVPEYHQSFSDAFQSALDSAMHKSNDGAGKNGSASKKKRAKNKVLFTTSMCRNK